jgi:hypothetical protein
MEQTTFFTELLSHFCGTMTPAYLLASMIFLLIGSMLNIGIDVFNRDERSLNTPVSFSWTFFLRDNRLRFLFNVLAAYSMVRFFSDIFPGLKFNFAWAWMLGLVFDWVWVALRELKYLANEKLKKVLRNQNINSENLTEKP